MNRYNAYFCREQAGMIRNPWYTKVYRCVTVLLSVVFANQLLAQTDSQCYADYIRNNSEGAVEFVLSKLKRYPIVAIGEDHWIADHTPFLCEVLWEASKNDDTRPKILALEFGNELDQRLANKIIHTSEFMPDSVIKILQHAPDIYGNPYKEYFDVIKCVWEINQGLDFEKKISRVFSLMFRKHHSKSPEILIKTRA